MRVLNYLHSGSLKANRSKAPTPSFSLHASTQPGCLAIHLQVAALYRTGFDYVVTIFEGWEEEEEGGEEEEEEEKWGE